MLGAGSMWMESVEAIKPFWAIRTLGGTIMDVGLALFAVNMVLTIKRGRPARPLPGAAAEGAVATAAY
jgi:cbb3-type cytochrome oxidase subunit 1